eukprot:6658667-Pyramimonas_sp.AAC.1
MCCGHEVPRTKGTNHFREKGIKGTQILKGWTKGHNSGRLECARLASDKVGGGSYLVSPTYLPTSLLESCRAKTLLVSPWAHRSCKSYFPLGTNQGVEKAARVSES